MGSQIVQIEFYLPELGRTNTDLKAMFAGVKPEKVETKLGISSRYISGPGETALDMAERACGKLFTRYDRNRIDYLLLCTQSPDYVLPASACILQDRLKLSRKIGALDFNLGCSGYIYGLSLAKGLIAGGIAASVLLVTAESYSKYLAPDDQGNMSLFGDAAAVTVVERCNEERIGQFCLGTDGSGFRHLIVENGASRSPRDGGKKDFLFMNGAEIVSFTMEVIPELVADVLARNGIQVAEIDCFVFHQANRYLLEILRQELQLPEDKFYINLRNTGNTVSASIPLALKQAEAAGRIKRGDKILLAGFGVGYSYGATVVIY